jgi:EmrB/QacA subfamily drug resistance transporter
MSIHAPEAPPRAAHDGGPAAPTSWAVLALLVVAQFMVVLDVSIVNVALPSIGSALRFAPDDLQWVVTAYVLCSGGLLLIGGRAADLLGRRRIFVAGLLVFTGASLACGLAPSAGFLVAARAIQGSGAALLTPAALAIVTTTYVGPDRVRALSIWGAVASGGVAVGVILGGVLTTWLTWHWVFFINVPVGLVAAVLTPRVVPAVPPATGRRRLDPLGALTVVGGLALLVYALSGAPVHGWGSARTLGLLALAAALLAGFTVVERRTAEPLLPPALWRVGSLVAGAVMMLAATGILVGTFFLNSVYLQGTLGWSALDSGLGLLPLVAAIAVGVHTTSRAIARVGAKAIVTAGMALLAAGALVLALAPDVARYAPDLLPGFCLLGLGIGLAFPAISITAMSDVDHATAGLASGMMSTAHEVGAALGVAVLSAIAVAASPAGIGYGHAFLAAAILAGALAFLAAAVVPAVRPAPGGHAGLH